MPPVATNMVVVGASELLAAIETIKSKVAAKAARRGIYAAVGIFRDEVKRRVPVRTGALKKAIAASTISKPIKGTKKYELVGRVGVTAKAYALTTKGTAKVIKKGKGEKRYKKGEIYPRNYAHLVEFGTRPHAIGKGSDLEIGSLKKKNLRPGPQKGRLHPGAKAQPFFRPAFDAKKQEAAAAFKAKVLETIEADSKAAASAAGTKRS